MPANATVGNAATAGITAWSFSDGVNTFDQTNSGGHFSFITDAKGNISEYLVSLFSPMQPHTVGQLIKHMVISSTGPTYYETATNDLLCSAVTPLPAGYPPDTCFTGSSTQNAYSTNVAAFAPNFAAVAPTLAKSFASTTVREGVPSTLTLTVTNPDPLVPLTGVTFTDVFPAGLVIAAPNGLVNTCGGTLLADAGDVAVILAGGTVPAAGSCSITVSVVASNAGQYVNQTSTVTTAESLPGPAAGATLAVAPPVVPVPALGPWALVLLALILSIAGAARVRRGG